MADLLARLATALADRYRLERELGAGGMATVYLAEDLKHHRNVAIKVLKPELAAIIGTERFLREIEIAARLQHPHILPLHDSGEAGGLLYYVMPFVEGESLRQRLDREKQLSIDDAVRIAREVGDALSYAHSHDVIHRDIKPENIMLTAGHAVVADFGIARAVTVAGGERITETGIAIGTPAYMSPEQSSGEHQVDGRSDTYSLGCVLYEMLAGEPPYTGPSARAVFAKRLSEPLPRISVVREAVTASVEEALTKALARVPADRFATTEQFVRALKNGVQKPSEVPVPPEPQLKLLKVLAHRGSLAVVTIAIALALWWAWQREGSAPVLDPNVIAVLPFRVTAPDSAFNYLREGIVDIANAWLTGDGGPRALDSRTTLSAWRQAVEDGGGEPSTKEALDLARRLGAGRIMLGEVVATPQGVTVSGRIIAVASGETLSQVREVGSGDELRLIDRFLAQLLVATAGETGARAAGLSDSVQAVKEYLVGLDAWRRMDPQAAATRLQRALEIDSTFALAALRLADVSAWLLSVPIIRYAGRLAWSSRDRLSTADRTRLPTIFAIGPNYPQPFTMAPYIHAWQRAAEANPSRPEVWSGLGAYLLFSGASASVEGWLERAEAALDSAIALDSTYAEALANRLEAALHRGDPKEIRRYTALFADIAPASYGDFFLWAAAKAVDDSAGLATAQARVQQILPDALFYWIGLAVIAGLPLDDVERGVIVRLGGHNASPDGRCLYHFHRATIAALRGRSTQAVAFADTASHDEGCSERVTWKRLVTLGLVQSGYDSAAQFAAHRLGVLGDTLMPGPNAWDPAGPTCYAELWRASQGDTSHTRANVARIRRLIVGLDHPPYPRVGRLEVCPLLLEASLEASAGQTMFPALGRLESVLQQETGLELPGNVANLWVWRWHEARGENRAALAAVRRHASHYNPDFNIVWPAYLRAEGRLAASVGDTAGAIRAYEHYLTLRDHPDPGPAAEEVRRVKEHLALLTAAFTGRTRR